MSTELTVESQTLTESLFDAVRILPPHRISQVLDFARWLQTQPEPDETEREAVSEAEIEAEEKAWEAAYMDNREQFRALARQALSDFEAGETIEMVIEDGKICPR